MARATNFTFARGQLTVGATEFERGAMMSETMTRRSLYLHPRGAYAVSWLCGCAGTVAKGSPTWMEATSLAFLIGLL